MLNSRTRWCVAEVDQSKRNELVDSLGLSPLVAGLLVNRGKQDIEEVTNFLHTENVDFYDPYLMDGMDLAVERIKKAIEQEEKILIFGDYDADGVSSTSVMIYTLRELGADFDYYIPNRFTEGYGPNEAAFRWAQDQGYTLIVTVDTGISAIHEAEVAKEIGLDLIITDHHEPQPELPDAYATINPKKPGCTYPFKGLAGVGVAFKVSHALLGEAPLHLLDIACIGTIADLVPLVDENRLIVKVGIQKLETTPKPGLRALLKVCGLVDKQLSSEHIGFGIGPRVNAAGRLDSADPAVDLFTTSDTDQAKMIAQEIDAVNKERQDLVNGITKEAVEIVEKQYPPDDNSVLVIAKEDWNPGVIGIVASRIVEKFYRPTIILSIDPEKGVAKGSARSITGFDMFENLSECRDILPHFGGHPMAAGMTLQLEYLDQLRERLNRQAKEKLTEEDFSPTTSIDLQCSVDDISLDVIEELKALEPFGVDNPKPRFLIDQCRLKEIRRIGSDSKHLKLSLKGDRSNLDVIGFHFGEVFEEITPNASISVVGELSINEWNGFRKPQLMIQDIAVKEKQLFDYRGIKNLTSRLELLDRNKVQLLSFKEETIESLSLKNWEDRIIQISEEVSLESLELEGRYLIILDLPSSKDQLKQLMNYGSSVERVYTVFHHEEDHYFNPIPTRDSFKWYYSFLKKQGTFDYKTRAADLAAYKGWTKESVYFMSQVFFELEFVTIDNGVITVTDQPMKRPLTESATYRRKQEQASLENDLCYSSYRDLKRWFFEDEKDAVRFEEAY
ncbi:single-stranded-DNA-specific exonuclease RecJ [Pseudalkalibacillus salsuginis]|uniref:single-stranded-DNA-specific exonuclease RecJ n=1 Tax=Pseudalkalibacillus salsuginis TaxID=2910972 RepID=UPI001F46E165|nr:single-stranded-DNA-specific exonuclease RecJ [Pseudalkalibacillus salsuginis]MCF6408629.1 single-stranded-DNA-specific exonuclease RecJ [Pseudalkalibacillus salsuginis]